MKRLLALMLTAVMLLGMTAGMALGTSALTYGELSYTVTDGKVTITDYKGPGNGVHIPATIDGNPVVAISARVFYGCTTLTSITIPEGVTEIGGEAFYGCKGLTTASLPSTLTHIGDGAFRGCIVLSTIDVGENNPNYATVDGVLFNKEQTVLLQCPGKKDGVYPVPATVTEIVEGAFSGCARLTEVTLPSGLTVIGNDAFEFCTALADINLPASLKSLGEGAFHGCEALTEMAIPAGIRQIGKRCFAACRALEKITMPAGIREIGDEAFYGCDVLDHVVLPAAVTAIGAAAFACCTELSDLTIGREVSVIGEDAFYESNALTISGYTSSAIETYAHDNDIDFLVLPALPAFSDLKETAYYYAAVRWAVENNITKGTTANTFSPNANCSRGEAVTFLWRAMGSPAPRASVNPFTDCNEKAFYYQAMLWAYENGIITGTTETTFSPGGLVDRRQFVTLLWRLDGKVEPEGQSAFTDVIEPNTFYYKPVLWAVKNGCTTGTTDDTFSPFMLCSRGQVATFLYRYMG